MQRKVFRGQMQVGAEAGVLRQFENRKAHLAGFLDRQEIMTLSVHRWKQQVFLYYECVGRGIAPEELCGDFNGLLESWPGGDVPRLWAPMMDIYHCCESVDGAYWKRKQPVTRVYARVNRLRPEMLSSYIFYHYQYQEEMPGAWAKYASIYLNEDLMFFYAEEPDGPEVVPYQGKLDTHNTPGQWQELMNQHFLPWEDDPEQNNPWREIQLLLFMQA